MNFCWPSCSLPFCLLLFYLSLPSFFRLVLWFWGLRTDRVLIALSQPCITNIFLLIIIIIIILYGVGIVYDDINFYTNRP